MLSALYAYRALLNYNSPDRKFIGKKPEHIYLGSLFTLSYSAQIIGKMLVIWIRIGFVKNN